MSTDTGEPQRVTEIAHTTDHVTAGKALLTSMFRSRPVIDGILASWLREVQEVEDVLWAVLNAYDIASAVGEQLNTLGALVGLSGDGLSTTHYRLALRAWILANRSNGTADEIGAMLSVLLDGGAFTLTEYEPATAVVDVSLAPEIGTDIISRVLRRAKAAGVKLQLVAPVDDDDFRFSSDGETASSSSTHGFAGADQTTGGRLVGAWE